MWFQRVRRHKRPKRSQTGRFKCSLVCCPSLVLAYATYVLHDQLPQQESSGLKQGEVESERSERDLATSMWCFANRGHGQCQTDKSIWSLYFTTSSQPSRFHVAEKSKAKKRSEMLATRVQTCLYIQKRCRRQTYMGTIDMKICTVKRQDEHSMQTKTKPDATQQLPGEKKTETGTGHFTPYCVGLSERARITFSFPSLWHC